MWCARSAEETALDALFSGAAAEQRRTASTSCARSSAGTTGLLHRLLLDVHGLLAIPLLWVPALLWVSASLWVASLLRVTSLTWWRVLLLIVVEHTTLTRTTAGRLRWRRWRCVALLWCWCAAVVVVLCCAHLAVVVVVVLGDVRLRL